MAQNSQKTNNGKKGDKLTFFKASTEKKFNVIEVALLNLIGLALWSISPTFY